MNVDVLTGKTTEHLVQLVGTELLVHKQMLKDFLRLQAAAKDSGFDLQICSAFRDYDRQLSIWNAKATGKRTLFDERENPLEFSRLSQSEVVFAILRWSALPGCSRHHWGSDIDVYDASKQARDEVKLVPSECTGSGPSAGLHDWLDQRMQAGESFSFFRPYSTDRGGVSPERWHLSYWPVARRMIDHFTFPLFKRSIEESSIELKSTVLEHADDIFHRFILNFDLP